MKNEKKELFVTEISLNDFVALNLIGYEHRKHHYRRGKNHNGQLESETEIQVSDTGEFVSDSHGQKHWVSYSDVFSRLKWDEVHLNDVVLENIKFSKEQGWNAPICVAIHEETLLPEEDFKKTNNEIDWEGRENACLFESSYLDKYMTPSGMQTYLLACNVKHLYSKRNYFYTIDDYFEIDKRETKAIYLIHWN
ncbi:MAG: hypothetical protein K5765_06885 [Clostridia bacterium]|nr:hypothetical protein [Clostridia bacterium]